MLEIRRPLALLLSCLALAGLAVAEVELAALFSDGMVIQRDGTARIWGGADPGERVQITASWPDAATKVATAGPDGRWSVTVPTPAAGGPYEIRATGRNEVVVQNVLAGEVWLGSGQSNMEWKIAACAPGMRDYESERALRDHPRLRIFDVANRISMLPATDVSGTWTACTPDTWPQMGAVAFYFALALQEELDVPIGVITADWGGTPAESWANRATIRKLPDFARLLYRVDAALSPGGLGEEAEWFDQHHATALHNGMIAPLMPYAIRGVIWYQGEANRTRPLQYRSLFPAMIEGWRTAWGRGDFPFYFVQIAPYGYRDDEGQAAELREAQLMTLDAVPNTGMAVTMDIGEPGDIHPANKWDVGRRLARWALAHEYGRTDLVYSGPLFRSMQIEGAQIRIRFDHAEGGLRTRDGPIKHLTIAGRDRVFHPALGEIEGDTLVVYSPDEGKPLAVRYGWGAADIPNLCNQAGLPASSFRTDGWERE